nr:MAG TPA: hypothetical protein [Caudoviricetes sp.]
MRKHKLRQGIAGGHPLCPCDECHDHSTQQSSDCTVFPIIPAGCAFFKCEPGEWALCCALIQKIRRC